MKPDLPQALLALSQPWNHSNSKISKFTGSCPSCSHGASSFVSFTSVFLGVRRLPPPCSQSSLSAAMTCAVCYTVALQTWPIIRVSIGFCLQPSAQWAADHPSSSSSPLPSRISGHPLPSRCMCSYREVPASLADWITYVGSYHTEMLSALCGGSVVVFQNYWQWAEAFLIGSFSHTLPGNFCYCS